MERIWKKSNHCISANRKKGFQLCEDKISIEALDENRGRRVLFETDFRSVFPYRSNLAEKYDEIYFDYIASFIVDILSDSTNESNMFTGWRKKNEKGRLLCRALDDRMYAACIVRDNQLINRVKKANIAEGKSGKFCFSKRRRKETKNLNVMKSLYELIFIDVPGGVSCPTERMMMLLQNNQVYDRWLEEGTLYGVTNHFFVCVTGEGGPDDDILKPMVLDPFLVLYLQMAALCLAQRCSIILFQKRASIFTNGMAEHGYDLNRKNALRLLGLQENLIAFQNQLQFFEVTVQEQGTELYDMLCSSLFEKEKRMLEEQIGLAYQAATVNQGVKFSHGALVISILGIMLTAFGSIPALQSSMQITEPEDLCYLFVAMAVVLLLSFIMLVWFRILRRKRKKSYDVFCRCRDGRFVWGFYQYRG